MNINTLIRRGEINELVKEFHDRQVRGRSSFNSPSYTFCIIDFNWSNTKISDFNGNELYTYGFMHF